MCKEEPDEEEMNDWLHSISLTTQFFSCNTDFDFSLILKMCKGFQNDLQFSSYSTTVMLLVHTLYSASRTHEI
jgi:hypothetical protein